MNRFSEQLQIPVKITHQLIHWQILGKARKETRLHQQMCITKWVSGVVPTGVVMIEKKQRIQSNYPICNHPEEEKTHILQCQAESIKDLRSNLLEELKCWLTSIYTNPDIIIFLTTGYRRGYQLQMILT